jgi:hypothetical protein
LGKNVIISDISEGGCYIFVDFLIDSQAVLPVLIVCGSFNINIQVKIMRIAKESEKYYGYGLMFEKINDVQKEGLKKLLKKLKSFSSYDSAIDESEDKRGSTRYIVGYDLSVFTGNENSPACLLDISRNGCSVETAASMESNSKCIFNFNIQGINYEISSRVIWKKGDTGRISYGLRFTDSDKNSRKALKKMISHATHLGAGKRKMDKKQYNELIEEKLDHTPYVIIRLIKRIFSMKTG